MTEIAYLKNADAVADVLKNAAFAVTDSNVYKLYPSLTRNAFVIPAGENSKTPETLFAVLNAMHERGVCRNDTIAAVGGGVVGDITGLASSLYMRGTDWISIPTTLLAMVDSGLGGKTAVDFCGVKNLIGSFHAPRKMCVAFDFIETLAEREIKSGIGEIIKTCLLSKSAFRFLTSQTDALCDYGKAGEFEAIIAEFIEICINIKAEIVSRDYRESGLRRILNVGHTVGHALESVNGYASGHGEYVLMGMLTECAMFREYIDKDYFNELVGLLKRFTITPKTTANAVTERALSDKKNSGGNIGVMLPTAVGEVTEIAVSPEEFKRRYAIAVKELKG